MDVTKRDFQVVYIYYVDVILVHIKTRLVLLGIQTFRWDQRLQLQNFFMALGRQYSNLNRHVSTQETCLNAMK